MPCAGSAGCRLHPWACRCPALLLAVCADLYALLDQLSLPDARKVFNASLVVALVTDALEVNCLLA